MQVAVHDLSSISIRISGTIAFRSDPDAHLGNSYRWFSLDRNFEERKYGGKRQTEVGFGRDRCPEGK